MSAPQNSPTGADAPDSAAAGHTLAAESNSAAPAADTPVVADTFASGASPASEKKVLFADLDLSKPMLASLEKAGYLEPTPVQAGVIPVALEEHDVIAQARTGTGKTAAFLIPILELLSPQKETRLPQALILTPTRELAVQVRDEAVKLAHGQRVKSVALYGGKPLRGQVDKLRDEHPQIIVGTPGRVLDHLSRRTLDVRDLWCVVLDEADRMLDIGFRPDIEKILARVPKDRQTLLLSATIPPPIERLCQRYMHEPRKLNFSPKELAVETIEQFYFTVAAERKFDLLVELLKREKPRQAIVFCRTKRGTDRVQDRLHKRFPGTSCLHGDLAQSARDRVMRQFRDGEVSILVATDIVGRGIDVSTISHIVNFDIPQFCDDYVHRVGRTGRMGREGVAYTFVAPDEGPELTRIEQRINLVLKRDEIPGFDATAIRRVALPSETESEAAPPPAPPAEMLKRPKKRYRRAL